ncbi:Glycoside hydrolase superfamily [Acididesulfobacillus acetoxydans]|uniref:Glycoside hydrolase superfamily n=1 Tax=Acididesulfobacillus acetoxydans TaxID=1561005 RepID=A0A8S0W691_9FIRM|nr:cell wall-binding repeat-containing protein [Acididesulfobacillus acetoxydans]CAA7599619.1 Glycoside hydrolase superfamily [Acididesulfobacillus acetoxydans]CEJ06470.1 N-acetylmuramoyl-L-alanine amidase LytC [Acididesulfobacillus acetoxydans]
MKSLFRPCGPSEFIPKRTSRFRKVSLLLVCTLTLLLGRTLILPPPGQAATVLNPVFSRLAGVDRYATAARIAETGWTQANTVILARGDDYPDALAGGVLARTMDAPLLLSDPHALPAVTLSAIHDLQAKRVFLLGGSGALGPQVESSLMSLGLSVQRLAGTDRYGTAAAVAEAAVSHTSQAFLASGSSFADALSVSSYAAAQGIPLLLTDSNALPDVTLQALRNLGVSSVTLIGGTGAIAPSVENALEAAHFTVKRLAGPDRYTTNMAVVSALNFTGSQVYVATGETFPDALAGAPLAAQTNSPVVLVPPQPLPPATLSYISARRSAGASFILLGGWGAIPYGTESILRTGSLQPRLSLQYVQGSSFAGEESQVNIIPHPATSYADVVAPGWYYLNDPPAGSSSADGSLSGIWDSSTADGQYVQFVSLAHSRGLKVFPTLTGGSGTDSVLTSDTARAKLVRQIVGRLQATGADGIVVDLESMRASSGPGLTELVQALAAALHPLNKQVVVAVMSRTGAESWYTQYNYHDLAQAADYLDLMTYDFSTATPGPVAPLDWVNAVLSYTQGQGVDMSKVLLGLPYYARDWTVVPPRGDQPATYTHVHWNLSDTLNLAKTYNASIQRDTSSYVANSTFKDTVGIPHFTYTDANKAQHIVYFDDPQSWNAKLGLLDQYHLGGVADWSLYWVDSDTAKQLFPLLQEHLR